MSCGRCWNGRLNGSTDLITAALARFPRLAQLISARLDERRLQLSLLRLRRAGVEIETVYDIGAHRGEWTDSVRASLPNARFFLFEANATHADALREAGDPFFIAVLSAEAKAVAFYGTGAPGDSYFREATKNYAGVEPTMLTATTLDAVIDRHNLPGADLIKVDVQGAELDVLRGGERTLRRAKLVLLECPLVEYNEGAPSIDEYLRFMREHGFSPIEFLEPIWNKRRMIQIDVLFARDDLQVNA